MKDQNILEIPINHFEKIDKDPSGKEDALKYMRRKHPDACFVDEKGKITGIILHKQDGLGELTLDANTYGDLQYLNLAENKSLSKITFQGAFPHLKHIDLSKCGLIEIILPKKGFPVLEQLYLGGNELAAIDFQGDYPVLELLNIGENAFLEKTTLLGNFDKLKYLSFYKKEEKDDEEKRNKAFKDFDFNSIPNLQVLDLENCQLEQLPDNFLELKGLEILYLNGNTIKDVPQTVIGSGERHNAAIDLFNYLSSISTAKEEAIKKGGSEADALEYLHQSKLFLIGNGEVGKTSIRRKLMDRKAPLVHKDDRTEIIETEPYIVKNIPTEVSHLAKVIDYRFDIWDFGGQDKYREIQQLFCSPKSLYVYVTSPKDKSDKEDYVGYEYWLSMVKAYAYDKEEKKDSPVIFVVNKIDEGDLFIGEDEIVDCFSNAKKFHKISADTLVGFDEFEKEIRNVIPEISKDVFLDKYARPWMGVKEKLEILSETKQHIYLQEYLAEICKDVLKEEEAKSWLRILDRIGTVIYFGEHEGLKDWIILNPEWVKNALSKVIEKALDNYGVVRETELIEIWKVYDDEEQAKFKVLLLKYKLAYLQKNPHSDTIYIIPSALPLKQLVFPEILKEAPVFQLKFVFDPFIPAGTVSKLTVGLFENIFEHLYWRKNVVLNDNYKAYAHVWEDWKNSVVLVNFYGNNPVDLFYLIIGELQKNISNLKDTKQFTKLDFTIEGFDKGTWESAETLKKYKVELYSFLWEDRRIGKREMPLEIIEIPTKIDLWTYETEMKILFLASNPESLGKLALENEYAKIHKVVEDNDKIKIHSKFAVNIREMKEAILDYKPVIIHFSGHGQKGTEEERKLENFADELSKYSTNVERPKASAGLIFHDDDKHGSEILSAKSAAFVFKQALQRAPIKVIILNNCYSEEQAIEISKLGIYVMGISNEIKDTAAIRLSREIYRIIAKSPVLNENCLMEAIYNGIFMASDYYSQDIEEKVALFYKGSRLELRK